MANLADWVEGARPRTLPASVAPVFAGTGIAMWLGVKREDLVRSGPKEHDPNDPNA